jgi:hypothetical protein
MTLAFFFEESSFANCPLNHLRVVQFFAPVKYRSLYVHVAAAYNPLV